MSSDEIQKWAQSILNETAEKWRSLKDKYDFWQSGFAVFYSPVYANPDLMIIGYNPGGGEKDFDFECSTALPNQHDYFVKDDRGNYYPLAKEMIRVFTDIDRKDLLERSVKLNLIFFRSRNTNEFNNMDKYVRKEIEAFCHGKVMEVITRLKPKIIITEGVQTYDKLLLLLERQSSFEKGCRNRLTKYAYAMDERRTYCDCYYDSTRIIGFLHLSGARPRPSEFELEIIKQSLDHDFNESGI